MGVGVGGSKHRTRKTIVNSIEETGWINYFENVFIEGVERRNQTIDCDLTDESDDTFLYAEISELEIRKAIRQLKTGKAAGLDGILAEMLKKAETEIVHYLKVHLM